jgi:hypothetical protein
VIYAQGSDLLKRGKLVEAQTEAYKLLRGADRCRLLLGIARTRAVKTPPKETDADIWTCLSELPDVRPDDRPAIQVSAAEVIARTDPMAALSTLLQAVEGYNRIATRQTSASEKPDQHAGGAEPPRIYAEPVPLGDFEQVIPLLMRTDPEGTEAAVSILQSEPLLGRCLVAILALRQELSRQEPKRVAPQ